MGMIFMLYTASADEASRLEQSGAEEFFESREFGVTALSLEKSWHGLHATLSGDAWGGDGPLAFLLAGGEPVGEDLGYGPARLMQPGEVVATANALEGLTDVEFEKRFNPDTLAEQDIYPMVWDEARDDLLDEYRSYFQQLRDFIRKAAQKGQALVLVMS